MMSNGLLTVFQCLATPGKPHAYIMYYTHNTHGHPLIYLNKFPIKIHVRIAGSILPGLLDFEQTNLYCKLKSLIVV